MLSEESYVNYISTSSASSLYNDIYERLITDKQCKLEEKKLKKWEYLFNASKNYSTMIYPENKHNFFSFSKLVYKKVKMFNKTLICHIPLKEDLPRAFELAWENEKHSLEQILMFLILELSLFWIEIKLDIQKFLIEKNNKENNNFSKEIKIESLIKINEEDFSSVSNSVSNFSNELSLNNLLNADLLLKKKQKRRKKNKSQLFKLNENDSIISSVQIYIDYIDTNYHTSFYNDMYIFLHPEHKDKEENKLAIQRSLGHLNKDSKYYEIMPYPKNEENFLSNSNLAYKQVKQFKNTKACFIPLKSELNSILELAWQKINTIKNEQIIYEFIIVKLFFYWKSMYNNIKDFVTKKENHKIQSAIGGDFKEISSPINIIINSSSTKNKKKNPNIRLIKKAKLVKKLKEENLKLKEIISEKQKIVSMSPRISIKENEEIVFSKVNDSIQTSFYDINASIN